MSRGRVAPDSGNSGRTGLGPLGEEVCSNLLPAHGDGEKEALQLVAAQFAQQYGLRLCLHTLGNHGQSEGTA